jgi:hypothetical protein
MDPIKFANDLKNENEFKIGKNLTFPLTYVLQNPHIYTFCTEVLRFQLLYSFPKTCKFFFHKMLSKKSETTGQHWRKLKS